MPLAIRLQSIDKVSLMFNERSESPHIIVSESIGNWDFPVVIPVQFGEKVLANSTNQVVVEGFTEQPNYPSKIARLTWNKNTYEWTVEEMYEALGSYSDLLMADGYGNNTALVNGYFSQYKAIDSVRNTAPSIFDMQYPSADESTDALFEAVNSTDLDGDIVSWQWQHVSGPYALFLNPSDATTKVLLGTTDADGVSISKLIVTDANNNSSESLFSIPVVDTTPGKDIVAPVSTLDARKWSPKGSRIVYKFYDFTTNELDSRVFWMYSGTDILEGGYSKDVWYVYEGSTISFELTGDGGRMYYYAIDRSGNKEETQDVRVGGKGK